MSDLVGNPKDRFSHVAAPLSMYVNACVRSFSNGKNGTIGRQIPFKVLPMVPLVMPLVPMVPMLPTYIRQQIVQTEYSVGNSTNAGKVT